MNNCGNCQFARPLEGSDTVISCQFNPPMVTAVVGQMVSSHWPLLSKDKWCGRYARVAARGRSRKAGSDGSDRISPKKGEGRK